MRLLTIFLMLIISTLNGWALSFTVDNINYSTTGSNTVEVVTGNYTGAKTIPYSVVYSDTTYTVNAIGNYAFYNCADLASITIPSSITSLGLGAFRSCISLTTINIPSSVTSIGSFAFMDCFGLSSITIPSSVTSIGNSALSGSSGLINVDPNNKNYSSKDGVLYDKNITKLIHCPISVMGNINIPSSVTSIGNNAFWSCIYLTSITIPSSVTSIGSEAFYSCTGLTSIAIPSSVTSIFQHAFYKCTGLITVDSNNKNYSSEVGVLYDKNQNTLIHCPMTVMGNFNIPSSVISIGLGAFKDCSGLISMTILSSVTSIRFDAFNNCTSLSSIKVNATTPPSLDVDVFSLVDKTKCVLYVPTGSLSVYQTADQWKDFLTILEFDPTGIDDVKLAKLSIYPNPTQSHVTIELGKPSSNAQLVIVNAQGQKVYECQPSKERISLDVSHYLAGMYVVDVKGVTIRVTRLVSLLCSNVISKHKTVIFSQSKIGTTNQNRFIKSFK